MVQALPNCSIRELPVTCTISAPVQGVDTCERTSGGMRTTWPQFDGCPSVWRPCSMLALKLVRPATIDRASARVQCGGRRAVADCSIPSNGHPLQSSPVDRSTFVSSISPLPKIRCEFLRLPPVQTALESAAQKEGSLFAK